MSPELLLWYFFHQCCQLVQIENSEYFVMSLSFHCLVASFYCHPLSLTILSGSVQCCQFSYKVIWQLVTLGTSTENRWWQRALENGSGRTMKGKGRGIVLYVCVIQHESQCTLGTSSDFFFIFTFSFLCHAYVCINLFCSYFWILVKSIFTKKVIFVLYVWDLLIP